MSNSEDKYLLDGIVELEYLYRHVRSWQKLLLRTLITAWNVSIFSLISMNFAIASTGAHIVKVCSNAWLSPYDASLSLNLSQNLW